MKRLASDPVAFVGRMGEVAVHAAPLSSCVARNGLSLIPLAPGAGARLPGDGHMGPARTRMERSRCTLSSRAIAHMTARDQGTTEGHEDDR